MLADYEVFKSVAGFIVDPRDQTLLYYKLLQLNWIGSYLHPKQPGLNSKLQRLHCTGCGKLQERARREAFVLGEVLRCEAQQEENELPVWRGTVSTSAIRRLPEEELEHCDGPVLPPQQSQCARRGRHLPLYPERTAANHATR